MDKDSNLQVDNSQVNNFTHSMRNIKLQKFLIKYCIIPRIKHILSHYPDLILWSRKKAESKFALELQIQFGISSQALHFTSTNQKLGQTILLLHWYNNFIANFNWFFYSYLKHLLIPNSIKSLRPKSTTTKSFPRRIFI